MPALTLATPEVRVAFRQQIAKVARAELGTVERPVNRTKYGAWYGLDGMSWCAQFVSWVYDQAATKAGCENPLAGLQGPRGFAGCTDAFERMKRRGWVLGPDETLRTGDIVIWDHDDKAGGAGHTGLVVSAIVKARYGTIEGNTNTAFSRTGGQVCRHDHERTDHKHGRLLGFCRPTRKFGP